MHPEWFYGTAAFFPVVADLQIGQAPPSPGNQLFYTLLLTARFLLIAIRIARRGCARFRRIRSRTVGPCPIRLGRVSRSGRVRRARGLARSRRRIFRPRGLGRRRISRSYRLDYGRRTGRTGRTRRGPSDSRRDQRRSASPTQCIRLTIIGFRLHLRCSVIRRRMHVRPTVQQAFRSMNRCLLRPRRVLFHGHPGQRLLIRLGNRHPERLQFVLC